MDWRSVCPISSALDVLGDKWSLLIIRDLIVHGPRTYSELLKSPEHISTNILAARLDLLVGLKLIQRVNPQASQRNNAFQLTESGAELRPILIALGGWAQVHLKRIGHSTASTEVSHLKPLSPAPFFTLSALTELLPRSPDPIVNQKSALCGPIPNLKIHRHKPAQGESKTLTQLYQFTL